MNNIAKKTVKAAVLLGVATLTCIAACSCTKTAKYEDDLSGYVTLGEYKGLTISSETIDEQLGSTINTLISKNTKTNDFTDRALVSGDTAKVKYTLTSGESEVETKVDYSVILGTATDLFAESLIGHSVGDEYTVDVTLPDDYSNADYAGKAATYSITVSSATETVVPELTDAFVAEKTDYETVDEYKAATRLDVRKNLLWEDVIAGCRFSSYPEKNIKIYYDNGIEYYNNLFNYYASLSGSSSSSGDIYSRFGTTKEKIYKQAADNALQQVKQDLVALSIAKVEGITVSDDEYNTYISEHYSKLGYSDEKAMTKAVSHDNIERSAILEKVIDLINDNASEN